MTHEIIILYDEEWFSTTMVGDKFDIWRLHDLLDKLIDGAMDDES